MVITYDYYISLSWLHIINCDFGGMFKFELGRRMMDEINLKSNRVFTPDFLGFLVKSFTYYSLFLYIVFPPKHQH
jgi:hypothetical protein